MKINSDFRDLLRSLNAAGVKYLVVGGYAVMVHTELRYKKDILTSVLGLDFETAWSRKIAVDFSGVEAPVLCREDILAAKIAFGRARDRRARELRRNKAETPV